MITTSHPAPTGPAFIPSPMPTPDPELVLEALPVGLCVADPIDDDAPDASDVLCLRADPAHLDVCPVDA